MKDTKKAGNLIISLAVIAISVIFYIQASRMPTAERGIGPGDYPRFICCGLFIFGIINIVSTMIKSRGIPLIDVKEINWRYLLRALVMFAMTFVYYKLLKPVGFLLTTPFYLFASSMLFGYRKKVKAAVIALVFTVAVYFLFVRVFLVILPRGILG